MAKKEKASEAQGTAAVSPTAATTVETQRSELDHLAAEPVTVTLGSKSFVLKPEPFGRLRKIMKTLLELVKNSVGITKMEFTPETVDLIGSLLFDNPYKIIQTILPEATEEDIDNAYPEQLAEVINTFSRLNFTALRKLYGQITGGIAIGL